MVSNRNKDNYVTETQKYLASRSHTECINITGSRAGFLDGGLRARVLYVCSHSTPPQAKRTFFLTTLPLLVTIRGILVSLVMFVCDVQLCAGVFDTTLEVFSGSLVS